MTAEDVRRVLHQIEKQGAMRLRNAVRVMLLRLYSWAAEDGPAHLRRLDTAMTVHECRHTVCTFA